MTHKLFALMTILASVLVAANADARRCNSQSPTVLQKIVNEMVDKSVSPMVCPPYGITIGSVLAVGDNFCCYDITSLNFYCCDRNSITENTILNILGIVLVIAVLSAILSTIIYCLRRVLCPCCC
ncbi:uncharacterized protein LOC135937799 [Cloeon dipterum]|uniref:uncharacterized protein LOC135937799 n=1 Tax=Cloeon dipterum TaxID=197152 RepID=UPI00322021A5